jgi:hypothetical protein
MGVTAARQYSDSSTTAILVQGMYASGTSLLSCVISLLTQARPGEAADPDDDPFPHLIQGGAVAGLNRRVLQELGSSWSKPCLLFLRGKGAVESAPLIRQAIRERYLQSAVGILSSGATGIGPTVLEDPGICPLRDLWDAALRELGYSARIVHIFRNPLEVAASLKERHGLLQTTTLQLWVHYNLAALTAQGQQDPLVVPYADVVNPDSGLVSRLATYLNLPRPALSDQDMQAAWKRLIEPAIHETSIPDHVVGRSPLLPSLVKRLYALLTEWEAHNSERREVELTDLAASFEDQSLFAGNLVAVTLPEQPKPPAPFVSAGAGDTRKLLIHYHLFKNAGTSVDAILRRNFGDRWINTEFPPRSQVDHQEAIRLFLRDNPHLAAMSSHTLMLPVPRIDGIEIFPIVFVRHPLDRLKSAYEFERKQDAMTVGTQIAKELDFAGYIRARLAIAGDRACRDFQVFRLAMAVPATEGSEQDRALAAVDRLPFVGLVEAFTASAELLQQLVRPMFPEFQSFDVRANVTPARRDNLAERLDDIREELDEACFAMVMSANEADMALYERVTALYEVAAVGSTSHPRPCRTSV